MGYQTSMTQKKPRAHRRLLPLKVCLQRRRVPRMYRRDLALDVRGGNLDIHPRWRFLQRACLDLTEPMLAAWEVRQECRPQGCTHLDVCKCRRDLTLVCKCRRDLTLVAEHPFHAQHLKTFLCCFASRRRMKFAICWSSRGCQLTLVRAAGVALHQNDCV